MNEADVTQLIGICRLNIGDDNWSSNERLVKSDGPIMSISSKVPKLLLGHWGGPCKARGFTTPCIDMGVMYAGLWGAIWGSALIVGAWLRAVGLRFGGVGGSWCREKASAKREVVMGDCALSEQPSDESCRCIWPAFCFHNSCCMTSVFSSKRSPLLWSRAPSRVSRSCVRGWPFASHFNGSPGHPSPSLERRYSSWRPYTSQACCCSSISTYLVDER